jgi:hypothetical protein
MVTEGRICTVELAHGQRQAVEAQPLERGRPRYAVQLRLSHSCRTLNWVNVSAALTQHTSAREGEGRTQVSSKVALCAVREVERFQRRRKHLVSSPPQETVSSRSHDCTPGGGAGTHAKRAGAQVADGAQIELTQLGQAGQVTHALGRDVRVAHVERDQTLRQVSQPCVVGWTRSSRQSAEALSHQITERASKATRHRDR